MSISRKTLEYLAVTKNWAWCGMRFLEVNKSKIQFGIYCVAIVFLVIDLFCNPLRYEVFFGLLFAANISVLRGAKLVREKSLRKLENELDSLSGENRVDEILFEQLPPPSEAKIQFFETFATSLLRRTSKKSKIVNHLGAALRALTLAPSFPRFQPVYPSKS